MDSAIGLLLGLLLIGAGLYMLTSDRIAAARGNWSRAVFGRPSRSKPTAFDTADNTVRALIIVGCGVLMLVGALQRL